MSHTTDTVSAPAILPAPASKDPMPDAGAQTPRRGGVDNSRPDFDRDDPSAGASSHGEEEISFPETTSHSMLGASTPLYVAGVAILLVVIVSSPLIFPPPKGWFRSGAALVVLSILSLVWRSSRNHSLSAAKSDFLQLLVVLAATGMCVVAQLWTPFSEVSTGFVIVPLVLSVMFRSVRTSLAANGVIAVAWAITWHSSGMTFTTHTLLSHLLFIPILSIALSITQQRALRELATFHEDQHKRTQERHSAIRLVAEQALLLAKSEAELHRKHALLELILATVPDEIFVKDRQRRVLVANHSYLEDVKLKLEDVLGESTDKLIPKNLIEISRETDMSVLRDGLHVRREIVAIYDDGTEKIFELEKMPLIENGEITGIVGIARDVTERKETEKRLKEQEILLLHASRLSSMGELVAGIAHEINQPLYSILNYAKAVKNVLDDSQEPNLADVSNWTDQILKEATRGGKITKRLRSFVRRAEAQREKACLTAIVRESIDFITEEARCADVEIQCDLGEKLPAVQVDRVQIQQVLVNLLKNAIEALREHNADSRRIVISTRCVSAGVEVAVADNGPGIPSDQTADVLEPFFTTKNEGIGLGLAISNTIIKAHQSKLLYETNDWGGTTFHFTLESAWNRFNQGASRKPVPVKGR